MGSVSFARKFNYIYIKKFVFCLHDIIVSKTGRGSYILDVACDDGMIFNHIFVQIIIINVLLTQGLGFIKFKDITTF